jgi:hypothetical protein
MMTEPNDVRATPPPDDSITPGSNVRRLLPRADEPAAKRPAPSHAPHDGPSGTDDDPGPAAA